MAVRTSASGQSYTNAIGLGTLTQFSVTCWGKLTVNRSALSAFWCLDVGANTDMMNLMCYSDGVTLRVLGEGSGFPTGVVLTVGTWYFMGVSLNGLNGTMTVRALSDSSFTTQTWTFTNAPGGSTNCATIRLGNSILDTNSWLNGCICSVKVWSGVTLTDLEMQNEAWSYMPRRLANLVAWYPLLKPETPDYSGNGHTLTGGSGNAFEAGPALAWGHRHGRIPSPPRASYALTTADTDVVTDSLVDIRVPKRAFADSVTESEALTGTRVLARVGTEAGSLATAIVDSRGYSRSQIDAESCAEAQTAARGNSRPCNDPELMAEALARSLGASKLLADSGILAEFLSRSSFSTRLTSNSLAFLETSAGTRLISRVLADVLSSLEMPGKSTGEARAVADGFILGDSFIAIRTFSRVFADAVNLAEFLTSTKLLSRNIADAQTMVEMVLRGYGVTNMTTDALAASDSPGSSSGTSRGFSDSCNSLDTVARLVSLLSSLTESLVLFDSYVVKQELFRNPSDSLNTAEMLTYIFSPGRNLVDLTQVIDSLAGLRGFLRGVADLIITGEENHRETSVFQVESDTLAVPDHCAPISVTARVTNNAISLVEAFATVIMLARNIIDVLNLAEILTSQSSYVSNRDITDSLNFAEVVAQNIQGFRDLTDVLDLAELLDETIGLERDQLENVSFVELLDQVTSYWSGLAENFNLAEIINALTTIIRGQDNILDFAESIGIGRAVASEDILTASDSGFGESAIQRAFSDDFSLGESFLSTISRVWSGVEDFNLSDEEIDSRYLTRALEELASVSENVSTLAWYYQVADDLLSIVDAVNRAGILVRFFEDADIIDEEIESIRSMAQAIAESLTRVEQAASIRAVAKDGADLLTTIDVLFTTLALDVTALDTVGATDSLTHLLTAVRALADNLHAWAWYGEGTKTLYRFPSETVHVWAWYEEGTKSLARSLDEDIDLDEYYEEGVRRLSRDISESIIAVDLLSGFVSTIRNIGDLFHLWAWYEEGVRHLIRNSSEELLIGETATSRWPRVAFDILDLDEYYEEGVRHLNRATPDILVLTPILFLGPLHIPSVYLYSSTMITDHGERTASVFRNVGGKTQLDQGS